MTYGSTRQGFSQATNRSYRIFTDQHDREWGADIENKTQAPCGALSARFKSPLRIAQKYLMLINPQSGKIEINYPLWIGELKQAHTDYAYTRLMEKRRMSPANWRDIPDNDQGLLDVIGAPPPPVQQVLAAQAGERWVLGLDDVKPAWADDYFPEVEEADELAFLKGTSADELAFIDVPKAKDEPTLEAEVPAEVGPAPPAEGLDESWNP